MTFAGKVFLSVLLALIVLSSALPAQPIDLSLEDVNVSQMPRVTFKACIRQNGQIVRGIDTSQILLLENGVPQLLSIRCPDPTETNSVVLVLDNSGSMLYICVALKLINQIIINLNFLTL